MWKALKKFGKKIGGGLLGGITGGLGATGGQLLGQKLFGAFGGPGMSGQQAGQSARAYFDQLAPDSTQFERLGSQAAGAGAQMGNTAEANRANRGIARLQAKMQKYQIDEQVKAQRDVAKLQADAQMYVGDKQAAATISGAEHTADGYVLSRYWDHAAPEQKAMLEQRLTGTRPTTPSASRSEQQAITQAKSGMITDEEVKGLSESELRQVVAEKIAGLAKQSIAERGATAREVEALNKHLEHVLSARKWDTVQKWTGWISAAISLGTGAAVIKSIGGMKALKPMATKLWQAIKKGDTKKINQMIQDLTKSQKNLPLKRKPGRPKGSKNKKKD